MNAHRAYGPFRHTCAFLLVVIIAALAAASLPATSSVYARPSLDKGPGPKADVTVAPHVASQALDALPAPDLALSPALQVSHAQTGGSLVYHYVLQNNTA